MSVLFRVDNDKGNNPEFNEYVKLNKLNNPLQNTKVVYINSNKSNSLERMDQYSFNF